MADLNAETRLAHRINSTNPNKIEMMLALEPGGPTSLEEAVDRVLSGRPVVEPVEAEGGTDEEGSEPIWT